MKIKKTITALVLSLIILSTSTTAFADGMMIMPAYDDTNWQYAQETHQEAVISYEGGLQKMLLNVDFEENQANGIVWLFPVPATPDKVVIDILKDNVTLRGREISSEASAELKQFRELYHLSQIYTMPIYGFLYSLRSSQQTSGFAVQEGMTDSLLSVGSQPDVIIQEHIEKEGITTELITAKTADGIYEYFEERDLEIEEGSIPVLDDYIGEDYSFVASWLTPKAKADTSPISVTRSRPAEASFQPQIIPKINQIKLPTKEMKKGVAVTFPTKKIYFPLIPTSVYGSEVVPAKISIIGHVSPKIFQDIETYSETEYYIGNRYTYPQVDNDAAEFLGITTGDLKYTRISIEAPSKFLTEDLWITARAPLKTILASAIINHLALIGITLFLLISLLAGIISSLILFKKTKPGFTGLFNIVTILGVVAATFVIGTKERSDEIKPLLSQLKEKGYLWKRKLAAILFLPGLVGIIVSGMSVYYIIDTLSYEYGRNNFFRKEDSWVATGTILITLVVVLVALFSRRIKEEDRALFEKLKARKYSSWSFYPKDKKKIAFSPVFSVIFIILSSFIIWLIKLAV